MQEEHCTSLYGVPTMFIAESEVADFDRFDLSSLRTGIMAGAPCPVELMKLVQTKMHLPEITIACGMTETSPLSTQTLPDDPLEKRVTTVGRVHPHVEIKIVTEAELIAHCQRQLAHFKTPRYWKFVDVFPMTVTGKVQKYRMREIALAELGVQGNTFGKAGCASTRS